MVARITRYLLLFQLVIAAAIAGLIVAIYGSDDTTTAILIGLGTVLVVRMAITFNNFMLAWRYRSETPFDYRIRWWQACRLFASEFRATMLSSSWTMAFHAFSRREAKQPEGLPVLLIHGYGCNSGYWHSMSHVLQKAHISHYAIDMEPVIAGIDDYVPLIHQTIERICSETGFDKLIIVAHSMGGLATRAYVRRHGTARIAKAITLGTPHHGTGLAHFGVGLNTKQMRWTATDQESPESEWLRELAASEDDSVRRLFVSIYSHHDNIISPQTSSQLEGATNIEFQGIGHVALALDPEIQAQVIREIRGTIPHRAPTLQPA